MNAIITAWILCALTPSTDYCQTMDLNVPDAIVGCYTPNADGIVAPDRVCAEWVEGWFPPPEGR